MQKSSVKCNLKKLKWLHIFAKMKGKDFCQTKQGAINPLKLQLPSAYAFSGQKNITEKGLEVVRDGVWGLEL